MKYLILSFFCIFSLIPATFADCPSSESSFSLSSYIEKCAEGTTGVDPSKTGDGVGGFKDFVKKIVTQVVTFGALFAVGAIVWAGIQYTKSFGDDEAVKQAKNTGVYALIGLLLLLMSFPFVDIIIDFIYRGFA